MEPGSEQQIPESRRESLRAHRQQSQDTIPTFFKTQEVNTNQTPNLNQPSDRFVFIMNKTSVFIFFLIVALVAVSVFALGFLLGYNVATPAPEESKEILKIADAKPIKATDTPLAKTFVATVDKDASETTTKPKEADEETLESILQEIAVQEKTTQIEELDEDIIATMFFAIELGASDEEATATDMVRELQKQGIKTYVTQSVDDTGRTLYLVRSGEYEDYGTAYKSMQGMPKPYSLWSKVVKTDKPFVQDTGKKK